MRRLGVEGNAAREHLVEDDAHRVEIAARVERLALALLGRHVLGRADDDALRGELLPASSGLALLGELRDAEVAHLHDVRRVALVVGAGEDHDVLGLEIAVHDAHLVRDGERRERLGHDVCHAPPGQRPVLADDVEEIAPVEELHRDVEQTVGLLPEVEHAHRVRVIELAGGLGLALEAGGERRVAGVLAVQHLDGDVLVEGDLPRPVDRAHRAAAHERLDEELAGDDTTEDRARPPLGRLRHPVCHDVEIVSGFRGP